jgi:hypothetical protein
MRPLRCLLLVGTNVSVKDRTMLALGEGHSIRQR